MKLTGVTKVYNGKKILDIKELNLEKGKIYAFVGENGAGKTTLFRLLAKLTFPTEGTIELDSEADKLGVMIESPAIDLDMTAEENLIWMSKVYGKENCMDIYELLDLVRLGNVKLKARRFSLGMKQRLGIAMCLLQKPNLLILDEPMNGLDPIGMVEVRNLLLKINEQGTTILISSHILEELYKLATDYIFIKKGEIIHRKSIQELEDLEKQTYELKTNDNKRALEYLREILGCEACIKDSQIIMDIGSKDLCDVSKSLAQNEIYILGLKEENFSIEEYYMGVMK